MAQIDCKEKGCTRKGYWVEQTPDGPVFCFRTRHDGENHAVKMTAAEIAQVLSSVEQAQDRAA